MTVLGSIGFTAPWLLLALLALPILWLILRAVPPAPIRRRFPGVALLLGLNDDETVSAVLYSFRRCPYAMRARLALASSGVQVELREILLRDKPRAFLDASPSGTVPCLVLEDRVIDESLNIMHWALNRADPQGWLDMHADGHALIARVDGPFKTALDRTKYATRYPDEDPDEHRAVAASFLTELDAQIDGYIFGKPTLADFATLPFIRQFAFIDKPWFDAQPWPDLQAWLAAFLDSANFTQIMSKYPPWQSGDAPLHFPD